MDKKKLEEKAYKEFKEFLSIALYLWIVFSLFIMYKAVVLRENMIDLIEHGVALINALVLGKFMLIAKTFRTAERANNAPLIYPTLSKSAIYAAILGVFKILEDVIVGYFHGKSFFDSISGLGVTWREFLMMTLILFVILIPFVGFGELDRVIGSGKLGQLFFRPRDTSQRLD